MKNIKAINYWVLGGFEGRKNFKTAIIDVKKMGLDGIEFTFGDSIKADITEEECASIKVFAKNEGVSLNSLATGFYWGCSLAAEDKEERKKALLFTEKYIRVASWLGVENILIIPGAVDVAWNEKRPVTSYKAVWKNSTLSIKSILKKAEKYKINICLENVWNKFLLSPIEFKYYLDQFESKYIGCYFDVGNVVINGYPEHWIEILGKYIKAVHFKNFSRKNSGGELSGFGENLLEGDVNFKNVITSLKKIKYKGPITAEMIPFSRLPYLNLPDMCLARRTARDMKRIFE